MDLILHLNESVEQNAGRYFEAAKKAKKKLQGAQKALEQSQRQLKELLQKEEQYYAEQVKPVQEIRKKEWYEKFHWFFSSEGFLCIGGKDAMSNEIVIKKYTDPQDLVFHTEMAGSPFFVIKNGQQAGETTKQEAAQATAVYSRAWKLSHTTAEVFFVKPEQVSKTAKAGEFVPRGSFIISGRVEHLHPQMEWSIGIIEGRLICGPESALQQKTSAYLILIPGDEKKSDLAKKIRHKLGGGSLDEIITFLPAGGGKLKK